MGKVLNIYTSISVVLILTITMRLLLAFQTHASFLHTIDGEFLSILTPDAALYGFYAKQLLNGLPHTTDIHLTEYIIYILVKITPFSIDEVMYFSPAFFSSLIIIPTMLLSYIYINSKTIVMCIGLIAGIGYGYYSRTYLGYFDTDVLNTFFPMMILYGMILTIKKENNNYILIAVISNILYLFWYHSSLPLIYAMNGLFILYCLLFHFKNTQLHKTSIILAASVISLIIWYKIILLIILFLAFRYIQLSYKYFIFIFFVVFLLVLYKIDINQFQFHANRYLFKSLTFDTNNFNFVSPMQHVSEAKSTNLQYIANLISGNIVLFGLSIFGYLLLVFRHKEMILALPMIVLGILSIKTGVRFHIYATAILAISYMFFIYFFISKFKLNKIISFALALVFFIPSGYENYKSMQYWNTKVAAPVFLPEQVKALRKLNKIASDGDYAVSWWDYGWPIWYYTGMKTMIDNGRHHADNYTVSNILLSNSQKFTNHASHYFYDIFDINNQDAITQALKKENNSETLFKKIENKELTTPKRADKYLILPIQMTRLIYTIFTYANINPQTGKKLSNPVFKIFNKVKEDKEFIYFNKNTKLDKQKSQLIQNNSKIPIKKFDRLAFRNGKKLLRSAVLNSKGLNLIELAHQYYLMDDYLYNTTLVQLLFFNKYDKRYFSPVYSGQTISIYKIK